MHFIFVTMRLIESISLIKLSRSFKEVSIFLYLGNKNTFYIQKQSIINYQLS